MAAMSGLRMVIMHHIRDTCTACRARPGAALRPFGLTNGQFSLMVAFNQAEPPAIGHLAPFLAMDPSTLTAAVKPLARRGLVRVVPDTTDRRYRRAQIMPERVALLRGASPAWRATHTTLDSELGHGTAEP